MKNYGLTSLSEFLGDFVVYRNLNPQDPRLPDLNQTASTVGVNPDPLPRKGEPDHARLIVQLLREARRMTSPGASLENLVYLGDTLNSDRKAFLQITKISGWNGRALITQENDHPVDISCREDTGPGIVHSNRWNHLAAFEADCRQQGLPLDETTVVLIDIDKTALGARGRNDHLINQARLEAIKSTAETYLEGYLKPEDFFTTYQMVNRPEFHFFTRDNQDFLAYLTMILTGKIISPRETLRRLQRRELKSFTQLLGEVENNLDQCPPGLREVHGLIANRYQAGDPTPFKEFRRQEYLSTRSRMGHCSDPGSTAELLESEIVITQEIRETAIRWRAQGALIFGLSDKPDEASLPSDHQRKLGYLPIHEQKTHAAGQPAGKV